MVPRTLVWVLALLANVLVAFATQESPLGPVNR